MPPEGQRYRDGRTSGISQMPVLAFSLRSIHRCTNDTALLRRFVPQLVQYWRWWSDERDVRGKGLVSVLHGWESGLDASPLYDAAFGLKHPGPVTPALYLELYPKFDELQGNYAAKYHWNRTAIIVRDKAPPLNSMDDSWFFVEDVGVNAVLIRGWEILGDLASATGNASLEQECHETADRLTAALVSECWDPERERFVTWWREPTGGWVTTEVEAVQSLFPLMLNLSGGLRDAVVRHLTNTSKFWTEYPIPSVARDQPTFTPTFTEAADLMWRGPSWGFPNWFVLEGLLRHASDAPALAEVAAELVRRWVAAVETGGIWEMWDPLTGEGAGVPGLGMSTLIVDAMARLSDRFVDQPYKF